MYPKVPSLGQFFFNISIIDLFHFTENVSTHNSADDNTLSAWTTTLSEVIRLLESERNIAVNLFTNNKMIINPDKFQTIILDKKKFDLTSKQLVIDKQQIQNVSWLEHSGIQ